MNGGRKGAWQGNEKNDWAAEKMTQVKDRPTADDKRKGEDRKKRIILSHVISDYKKLVSGKLQYFASQQRVETVHRGRNIPSRMSRQRRLFPATDCAHIGDSEAVLVSG